MNAILFFAFAGLLAVGLILILLGRRGRKLNNHPQCCWCGFDLDGIYPPSVTCPECGAGLKRQGAVRMGVRRTMPIVIGLGVILVIAPVLPIGLAVYAAATGMNLNEYKPAGLLVWESRYARPAAAEAIADELLVRMQVGKLSPEQCKRIALAALDRQEDTRRPWHEKWGDIVEQARTMKLMDKADMDRFAKGLTIVEFKARPTVRAGQRLPLTVSLKESRGGSSLNFMTDVLAVKTTLGDKTIRRQTYSVGGGLLGSLLGGSGPTVSAQLPVANWWTTGSKGRMGMMTQVQKGTWDYRIPKDFEPGKYELVVFARVRSTEWDPYAGQASSTLLNRGKEDGRAVTFRVPVEVLAADSPPIPPVAATPELDAELSRLLRPNQIDAHTYSGVPFGGSSASVQINFSIASLPVELAHRVVMVINGKQHDLGQLSSGDASDDANAGWSGWGNPGTRVVHANVASSLAKSTRFADIILKPDPRIAERLVDPKPVYGGELVFKKVPLQSYDASSGSTISKQNDAETEDEQAAESETNTDDNPEESPEEPG